MRFRQNNHDRTVVENIWNKNDGVDLFDCACNVASLTTLSCNTYEYIWLLYIKSNQVIKSNPNKPRL